MLEHLPLNCYTYKSTIVALEDKLVELQGKVPYKIISVEENLHLISKVGKLVHFALCRRLSLTISFKEKLQPKISFYQNL